MSIVHETPLKRILLSDSLILSRAYRIVVGIFTFSNASYIKEEYNGIRVVGFDLFICFATTHHGMTFVTVFFTSWIVAVQLPVTYPDYL